MYICTYTQNHDHHHHVSRHFSLSVIASGRSPGLHLVFPHSYCMYVRAGRPAFAQPYVGVHRSTSLMSSSLLLQQCPACLVRLTWIVFVMGGKGPYSWCFNPTIHRIVNKYIHQFVRKSYFSKRKITKFHSLGTVSNQNGYY